MKRACTALWIGGGLAVLSVACSEPCSEEPGTIDYAEDSRWACRPDVDGDACDLDLTATEVTASGELVTVEHVADPAPVADCFYVYPTVHMGVFSGVVDAEVDDAVTAVTRVQGARFSETCRVFAPAYRQAEIGTYLNGDLEVKDRCFAIGYSDVKSAFTRYLDVFSDGRPFALIGHSQGSHMVTRLLRDLFDDDDTLRARLVVAAIPGAGVSVPAGEIVGATFASVPLCTAADDVGCVLHYRTFPTGAEPARPPDKPELPEIRVEGGELACTGPRGDGANTTLSRTYLHTDAIRKGGFDIPEVDTPFVLLRDRYEAGCVRGEAGEFLQIHAVEDDARADAIGIDDDRWHGFAGMHNLDISVALGDLIDTVATRSRAWQAP